MNKFTIAEVDYESINAELPVLYKVWIGNKYYLHKGKDLKESLDKLLDDVFRGIRNKKYPDAYSNFVDYCNRYPATHRVMVEVILNADPAKVLSMEDKLYKSMKDDPETLNRIDIAPYKPEWMLKAKLQTRCDECITSGVVDGKKKRFNFCPQCGRLNKK